MDQESINAFNKELAELLQKHKVALGSESLIVDGKIVAKVVIVPEPKKENSSTPEEDTKIKSDEDGTTKTKAKKAK